MRGDTSVSVWRNASFVRLWVAQAISNAGSQISAVAIPLTAVLVLGATPVQMGILGMVGSAPNLLFDLFTGVWVDRSRRRPILIGADVGRALLLVTIPVAVMLGILSFIHLYLVVFLVGTLTAFFTLASISILPTIVQREQLVQANSTFATTDAVLTIAASSAAGGLVQLFSAPKVLLVDAASYIVSALSLRGINAPEQHRGRNQQTNIWSEIGEGIRELVRTPILRALAVSVSVGTFGVAMQGTVLILYLTQELQFTPPLVGLFYAFGGGGALVGSVLSHYVAHHGGMGRAIAGGNFLWALGILIIPFADGKFVIIATAQFVASLGVTIWSVNQKSLRQRITPVGLFARATAARRFLMFSLQIAGAGLGGVLGTVAGLQATMIIGALGLMSGFVLLYFSPVRAVGNHVDSGFSIG